VSGSTGAQSEAAHRIFGLRDIAFGGPSATPRRDGAALIDCSESIVCVRLLTFPLGQIRPVKMQSAKVGVVA